LHGLDPQGSYEVIDIDRETPETFTGQALMKSGLTLAVDKKPAALVLTYRKTQ
jgi:hypothetical protein